MSHIPNYLRTTANRYKGSIAEKIAFKHLRKKEFACSSFLHLTVIIEGLRRKNIDFERYEEQEIKDLEDALKLDLKMYSSRSPPKLGDALYFHQFEAYSRRGKSWEDFRKEKLELTYWRLEHLIKKLRKKLISLRPWQEYFESIQSYNNWLRKNTHYTPDFIAKKENEVYIVEVKSQTKGKLATFQKYQKKSLLKACEFGFKPMLIVIPIRINMEIGEPQLKIGKEHF